MIHETVVISKIALLKYCDDEGFNYYDTGIMTEYLHDEHPAYAYDHLDIWQIIDDGERVIVEFIPKRLSDPWK